MDRQHVYTDEGKGNTARRTATPARTSIIETQTQELAVWTLTPSLPPGAEEVTCSEEVEEESHFLNEDTSALCAEPGVMCCLRNLWLNSGRVPVTPVSATQVSPRCNTPWGCALDLD